METLREKRTDFRERWNDGADFFVVVRSILVLLQDKRVSECERFDTQKHNNDDFCEKKFLENFSKFSHSHLPSTLSMPSLSRFLSRGESTLR